MKNRKVVIKAKNVIKKNRNFHRNWLSLNQYFFIYRSVLCVCMLLKWFFCFSVIAVPLSHFAIRHALICVRTICEASLSWLKRVCGLLPLSFYFYFVQTRLNYISVRFRFVCVQRNTIIKWKFTPRNDKP